MTGKCVWLALGLLLLGSACSQNPGGAAAFKIAYVPSISGQSGIFSMNADTSGSRVIASDKSAQLRFASWSPDGKKIAFFTARAQDAQILKKYRMPYEYLLYVMDASGSNQKRLLDYPVIDFAWAPDARRMLVISAHEGEDRDSPEVLSANVNPLASLYVVDLKTGEQTWLRGSGRNCSAGWSPDGTRLAVTYGDADNGGIYVLRADGSDRSKLTDGSTIDHRPKWSPDGKSIVYVAYSKTDAAGKDAGVYIIGADGGNKRQVTGETPSYVRWSPDGSLLLLQSENAVRLTDLEGKKQVLLSARLQRAANAIFTPDGKGVMFCSDDEGAWNIYSIGLDGQNRKKITGRTNTSNFCLSPLLTGR
jgi:Tol biopolymer transport system component